MSTSSPLRRLISQARSAVYAAQGAPLSEASATELRDALTVARDTATAAQALVERIVEVIEARARAERAAGRGGAGA